MTDEAMIDLTPSPQDSIRARAAQNLTWLDALCELIDNSLDAGSTHVAITFAKGYFSITDNGKGQSDMAAFFREGQHSRHSSTVSGMYGVGGKDAQLWIGGADGEVLVKTVAAGVARQLRVRWGDVTTWKVPGSEDRVASPGEGGTQIVVQPTRPILHGEQWRALVEKIGYTYSLAIEGGAQITLSSGTTKGKPVLAPTWRMPALEPGLVETVVTVGSRRARVKAGVIAEGERTTHRGITYRRGFRVIIPASNRGCGDYSPGRVCGVVDLLEGWAPSRNKNGLVSGEDELYLAVEAAILPVLKRAEQASSLLGCQEFQAQVEELLNARVAAQAKAKRAPGSTKGAKSPTGSGAPHRRAEVEQAGNTFPGKRPNGAFRVEHQHLGGDTLGDVRGNTVLLNLDNSFVAYIQRSQNIEAGVVMAATLIGDVARGERANGQRILKALETETLPGAVGKILSSHPSIDGAPVLKSVAG